MTQGENGGKADEREISRTVTCDGHRHPHSSRVAWGLDDMWGFGRCHAQKYFTMQIRVSERWCCRIFEHFSEVHDIYPKLENIPVQNILFPIAEQALSLESTKIGAIKFFCLRKNGWVTIGRRHNFLKWCFGMWALRVTSKSCKAGRFCSSCLLERSMAHKLLTYRTQSQTQLWWQLRWEK